MLNFRKLKPESSFEKFLGQGFLAFGEHHGPIAKYQTQGKSRYRQKGWTAQRAGNGFRQVLVAYWLGRTNVYRSRKGFVFKGKPENLKYIRQVYP